VSGELLTIASLNPRGIPLTGSQLAERYAVIGAGLDAGDADVVCCQEVFTYWHLQAHPPAHALPWYHCFGRKVDHEP